MSIPISLISEPTRAILGIFGFRDPTVTELAEKIEWAEHKIKQLEPQLAIHAYNRTNLGRIRARIESFEAAINEVRAFTAPSVIGGTRGGNSRDSRSSIEGLVKCRRCDVELLTRREAFASARLCHACFSKFPKTNSDQPHDAAERKHP